MEIQNILYHPNRAIELASHVTGLTPVRLFALLYPLWLVEIDAFEETHRPYVVIEQFIERGIQEAHLQTVSEIAYFFGLSPSLVTKVLHFLATIQHVQQLNDGRWSLTRRGAQSLLQGIKSVSQNKRQYLYFDAFCSKPLQQNHYTRKVSIISDLDAESCTRTPTGGYRFYRLATSEKWSVKTLEDLIRHPNRLQFNLPQDFQAITAASYMDVYMPMYIIETKKQRQIRPYYLVYTHVRERRDPFFEHIVNETLSIQRTLEAVPRKEDLAETWLQWLQSQEKLAHLRPELTPEGLWRVNIPDVLFLSSMYPLQKIGTYHKEKGYFLQLWCTNNAIRRQAVLDHGLLLTVKSSKTLVREQLETVLQQWSESFDVSSVSIYELYKLAREQKVEDAILQKLADWCQAE
jgi:hypothetical protein